MKTTRMREIDGQKLKQAIMKTGKSGRMLSEELGYNSSFFLNNIKRNAISMVAVKFLDEKYGIKFEEYAKTEPEVKEEVPKSEEPTIEIDTKEIIDKINELVYVVNKLGNIQMQNMEYLKEIKDKLKERSFK